MHTHIYTRPRIHTHTHTHTLLYIILLYLYFTERAKRIFFPSAFRPDDARQHDTIFGYCGAHATTNPRRTQDRRRPRWGLKRTIPNRRSAMFAPEGISRATFILDLLPPDDAMFLFLLGSGPVQLGIIIIIII